MRKVILSVILLFITFSSFAQIDPFELMQRTDLTIDQIQTEADSWFKIHGKERGSGYKQFQRWLYERKFHIDDNGYFIDPQTEFSEAQIAASKMNQIGTAFGTKAVSGIWSELGPANWNKTSGWNPGTGRLVAMAIHPSSPNTIYVGSPGGGLWKTTNGGTSWIPLTEYNSVWQYIYSIAIDPLNQNIVYAGTGNGGNQIIKSTDGGNNWTVLGSGPTSNIRKILIHPTNTNLVFACANNGIYRSTNGGTSWSQVRTGAKEDIEFKPGNTNIMYACGSTEVVKSTDGGVTWNLLGNTEGITNTGRSFIAVTPANPEYVYIVQASGSVFGRLYKSTNSGVSFNTMVVGNATNGTNYFGYETDGTGTSGQASHDMALAVSPTNAEEVHLAGIICWKSTNGGTSFTATTAWSLPNSVGYNHADVHGLEFVNSTLFSLSDGGIYKSINNADDWTDLSAGLGIRQFYRIASSPTNGTVVTGGAQDNGSVAKQSSGTWVDWLGADGMEGLVSPTNHLNLWGTSQNGQLYRSTNGGSTRTSLASITGGAWVTPIAIHPTNETILFAGGTAVYKSTNSGSTFTNISGTTITNSLVDLAIAPSNANYIYACEGSNLYVTTNGGTSWLTKTAPGTITDICVSPTNPSKIWITLSGGTGRVHVSTDAGTTFTNITLTLPSIAARSVVVDNSTDEKIFVGMSIGVYTYSNSNPSWIAMTDNLPLVAINELDIQFATSKLRVATYGRGIWETSIATVACLAPSSLVANAITNTSATLVWGTVSGAINYSVEYKEASSSTWIVLSAATTATSYNLTGLTQGTSYDFRVKTNCSASSSFYALAQFTTTAPMPACITALEPNETLATALPVNQNTTISAGISSATDIDYYSITTTSYVNFNITLTNLPFDYDLELRNAAGTLLASSTQGGSNSELITLNTQATGTYYVVVFGYNGAYSIAQCYDLNIGTVVTSSCTIPTSLSTTNVAGTSATVSWSAVVGAVAYRVQYRVVGSSSWLQTALVTTTSTNLNSLQYNSNYEWQVRTICASDSSNYSGSTTFTTLPNCPPTVGSTMSLPIVVGQAPCITNPYTNTQTNSIANCFQNNYTGTNNQASPNVWYQFTLSAPATVEISHCNSTLNDTYIHLLNSSGGHIASNDDNGPVCGTSLKASISSVLAAGTYFVVSEGYGTGVGSITTKINTTNACNATLNLNLFIEGYYLGSGIMEPVMLNQGYSGSPAPTATDVDEITVELHEATTPFTLVASAVARLQTNGTVSLVYPPLTGNYYVVVKHKNTIETWSQSTVSMVAGATTNYNFTSGSAQAFGGNLTEVETGVWAVYSGDINQDSGIDVFDYLIINPDIVNGLSGYLATDLDGNGSVDGFDYLLLNENIINGIGVSTP